MRSIEATIGDVHVRWITGASAAEAVVDLCVRLGLEQSSFPSVERLTTLMLTNPQIILGVYSGAAGEESRLVGAAVVLPLSADTVRGLSDGSIDSGKKIGKNDVRRRWRSRSVGNDIYVSVLAADDGWRPSVMEAAARILAILQGPRTAFTRASTSAGRVSSQRLGFHPVRSTTNSIWVRPAPTSHSTLRHRGSGTLAAYDIRLNLMSVAIRVIRPVLWCLYGTTIAALILRVFVPGPASVWFVGLLTLAPSEITPVMGTAATLGGLSLTVFFLTAQLKLSGISQYGMTAIYRVRDILPLVALTGITVVSGIFVLVGSGVASTDVLAIIGGVAVISNTFLIAFIALLSVELIRNLDPVAVARRFARGLRGANAEEWGLVKVRQATGDIRLDVELRKNRTNFGLRDPLMPIHEIHLAATPQRYGQVLGVMAEQIARAYGCLWRQQFPDSGAWETRASLTIWSRIRRGLRMRRIRTGWRAERDRLQLAMLLLHYVKRVHRNGKLSVGEDHRRQSSLFVMSRLIVVLAAGVNTQRLSNEEVSLVLRLCLDTVLRIASDYALRPTAGIMSGHRPRVDNELFRAFPAAISALAENGHASLAVDAAQTARWILNSGAISRSRLAGFAEGLQDYPYLARILRDEDTLTLPGFVAESPWGPDVPEIDPTSRGLVIAWQRMVDAAAETGWENT